MTDILTAPPTHVAPQRELLSTHEVAALLGVTAQTVRNLVRSGDLPGVQLGGRPGHAVRVSRDDLDATLQRWKSQP